MTIPVLQEWPPGDSDYRRSEVSVVVGSGDVAWDRAAHDVLRWKVKTSSGFAVNTSDPASTGDQVVVTARLFGLSIIEPVEVVTVVEESGRVGFAYRTLPGHPVSGEEALIVHREGTDVRLTIRSLTRAAPQQPWRALYPLLRVVQGIVRRRYLRSLRGN